MALGGGTFLTQNKVLPGSYINFISVDKASASLSDRGVATMPLECNWGKDGAVFEVTNADFQKNSMKIFGYDYTADEMKGLRDLFLYAKTVYFYRLNSGVAATCAYGTAACSGTRGNDLKVVIALNVDDTSKFDVSLFMGTTKLDSQTVTNATGLVDNDFVHWTTTADLSITAATPFTGGTNGTVTGTQHQAYLDAIESYTFNTMGVVTTDATTKGLYSSFCKRMRDEVGAKFQCVLYNKAADYMGVINVKNKITDTTLNEASLVYWVTGVQAGCEVNKSCLNKKYDGEFNIDVAYTQSQLEAAIKAGEYTMHQVNSDIRVLSDINSMVTTTSEQGDVFKENQTVRVCDQIANDIALLFNTKYLGVVPNDAAGRTSLWADIVKHHEQLQDIRAIEDFSDTDVTVTQGNTKKAVVVSDYITVVNAMAQLYMTVQVA